MATTEAILGDQQQEGGWQEVKRRRSYPSNWRHGEQPLLTTKPYQPYARPTYAQVLRRHLTPTAIASHNQHRSSVIVRSPILRARLEKNKDAASLKRKCQSHSLSEPVKKIPPMGKEKEAVEVALNPRGFYEAKVNHDHVSKLAKGCGFTVKNVEEALQTDNLQREIQAAKKLAEPIKDPIKEPGSFRSRFRG